MFLRSVCLAAAAVAALGAGPVPADVTFAMGDGAHDVTVKPGGAFKVKLVDFRSTGFVWRSESLAPGLTMLQNTTGGGDDEPPFILCDMSASADFKGGDAVWMHVKPWDQSENSPATLHVKVATSVVV
eukprot:SRR837773.24402.p3 GENE.SRR837773.24402~~SRR837773.24402.p3  ORF type:complete len:142 (-),score=48.83 SRR837773.24402:62-445(-)